MMNQILIFKKWNNIQGKTIFRGKLIIIFRIRAENICELSEELIASIYDIYTMHSYQKDNEIITNWQTIGKLYFILFFYFFIFIFILFYY